VVTIYNLLSSPSIRRGDVSTLQEDIRMMKENLKETFPNFNWNFPNFHTLEHAALVIVFQGIIAEMSTLVFESYHQVIKHLLPLTNHYETLRQILVKVAQVSAFASDADDNIRVLTTQQKEEYKKFTGAQEKRAAGNATRPYSLVQKFFALSPDEIQLLNIAMEDELRQCDKFKGFKFDKTVVCPGRCLGFVALGELHTLEFVIMLRSNQQSFAKCKVWRRAPQDNPLTALHLNSGLEPFVEHHIAFVPLRSIIKVVDFYPDFPIEGVGIYNSWAQFPRRNWNTLFQR
jgi:hypothetical protein